MRRANAFYFLTYMLTVKSSPGIQKDAGAQPVKKV